MYDMDISAKKVLLTKYFIENKNEKKSLIVIYLDFCPFLCLLNLFEVSRSTVLSHKCIQA